MMMPAIAPLLTFDEDVDAPPTATAVLDEAADDVEDDDSAWLLVADVVGAAVLVDVPRHDESVPL